MVADGLSLLVTLGDLIDGIPLPAPAGHCVRRRLRMSSEREFE